MKEQSQDDKLENRRLVGLERQLYLYRELSVLSILGNCTATYATIDEVENGGNGIDGYYGIGATMRQISLVHHHALAQIGRAVFPIVVHRDQNIRE